LLNACHDNDHQQINYNQITDAIRYFYEVHTITPSNPEIISRKEEINTEYIFSEIDSGAALIEQYSKEGVNDGWKYRKSVDDIDIYMKQDDNPNHVVVKGSGIVDATPQTIMEFILDKEHIGRWDELCEGGQNLVEVDEMTTIVHLRYSTKVCLFKEARDFVCVRHLYKNNEGNYVLIAKSIDFDFPQLSGYVRGNAIGGFIAENVVDDPTKTKLTYISESDLNGWVSIVGLLDLREKFINRVFEKQPLNIRRIREFLKKERMS